MTQPSTSPYGASASAAFGLGRATDDARERAIRLLTDAYAYDVIPDFEFERRLSQLGHATSAASIDSIVADLSISGSPVREAVPGRSAIAPSEGRIVGFMSETRRTGPWRVPRHLVIRALMCDMKVDLRYAAIPPGCSIEVKAIMSSVTLIAPQGLVVSFDVDPVLGAARCDTTDGSLDNGRSAHVRIYGSAIMAEVRVRVRGLGR